MPNRAKLRAHILIVDDESSVRSALRRSLRREGYRLSFASSVSEALTYLRDDPPDVIISDHLMPQMTGLELMKRCRLLFPMVVRIVLTGQAEMETVLGAINDGEVFRFLTKPWDDDELKLALHLAIGQARENRSIQLGDRGGIIKSLEKQYPGIAAVDRDASGAIILPDTDRFAV